MSETTVMVQNKYSSPTLLSGGVSKSELQFGVTVVNLWRRFKGRVDSNLRHISVVDVLVAVPNTID